MDLYSTLNVESNLLFPGDVVSVFISNKEVVFVESVTSDTNYLIVFNNRGTLYWNVTFNGSVVYYDSDSTFIYDTKTEKMSALQVSRPIYVIEPSNFGN